MDAWSDPGGAGELVASAVAGLRRSGASIVHFWSADGAPTSADPPLRALRRLGLRGVSRGKKVIYRAVGDAQLPQMPDAREWMFRMGDTDGI